MKGEAGTLGAEAPMDRQLTDLKQKIDEMGRWALEMLRDGMRSLEREDQELAEEVIRRDARLDQFDVEIEQATVRAIIILHPVAHDARLITSGLKVISYLDRIGRHGYDIARIARASTSPARDEVWSVLEAMSAATLGMIEMALSAFRGEDISLAKEVYLADDRVDEMDRQVLRECARLTDEPGKGRSELIDYVRVSRAFERASDNACKIAEKTIYTATGKRRREFLTEGKHVL